MDNVKKEIEAAVSEAIIQAFDEGANKTVSEKAADVIAIHVIQCLLDKGYCLVNLNTSSGKKKGAIYEKQRSWYRSSGNSKEKNRR